MTNQFLNYTNRYYSAFYFLFILSVISPIASASSASSPNVLLARDNSTSITSATNSTNGTFSVIPVAVTRTLPWWTSLVGGVTDFCIGVYTLSVGWKRQQPADTAWSLSGTSAIKTITTAFGLCWTFFQSVNGLVHLHQNWGNRSLVRKVGGNGYIGLFSMACQMWSAKIRGRWMARIVAWIVAAVVIANFAMFTLPAIGTAPLYQLSSEWCAAVLDSSPSGVGNCASRYETITTSHVSFACVNSSALAFNGPPHIPTVVDYAFEGLMGLMFICTLIYQLRKDLEWLQWRKSAQQYQTNSQYQARQIWGQNGHHWQPQAGYGAPQYQHQGQYKPTYAVTTSITSESLNRDDYHPTRRNPHRSIAYVMWAVLYATNFVGVAAYVMTYYSSKSDAISATLGVCPGVSNTTAINVTAGFGSKGNCTCVDLRLPGEIQDLSVALGTHGNLARLLFNI